MVDSPVLSPSPGGIPPVDAFGQDFLHSQKGRSRQGENTIRMRTTRHLIAAGLLAAIFTSAPAQAESRLVSITAGPLVGGLEKNYTPDGQTVSCQSSSVLVMFVVEVIQGSGHFASVSPCGSKSFAFSDCVARAPEEGFSCATEGPEGGFAAVDTLTFHPLRTIDGFMRDSNRRRVWELFGTAPGTETP